MDAGGYKGFTYLTEQDVAPGFSYGKKIIDNKVSFKDESRIHFY